MPVHMGDPAASFQAATCGTHDGAEPGPAQSAHFGGVGALPAPAHHVEFKKVPSFRSAAVRLSRVDSARSQRSNRSGTGSFDGQASSITSARSSSRPPLSKCRDLCRNMVNNKTCSAFIYACIAFNTITIGMNDLYVERNNAHTLRAVIDVSDWAVLCVFTVEMALKMYAWGLGWSRKKTEEASKHEEFDSMIDNDDDDVGGYFSSNWNTFDCVIVVVSWSTAPLVYVAGTDGSIGRLVRAVRTARPLRALRSFDGTQDVLKTFPHAIPGMRDGITLLVFVFVVYAILGVNLFGVDGNFHGRCVVDDQNSTHGTKGLLQKDRGLEVLCGSAWRCGEGFRCSCRPEVLNDGTVQKKPWPFLDPETGDPGCLELGARRPWVDSAAPVPSCPDYGMTCFNNFAVAFLTCFKTITMDNWTVTMWWAQDAVHPIVGWLYFVSLVVLVSFNIVNLYVASISASYRQVRGQRLEINRIKKARRLRQAQSGHEARLVSGETNLEEEVENEAEPTFYVKFLGSMQPPRKRLNWVSHAFRQLVTYPQVIDECGSLVSSELLSLAIERSVVIKFGPEVGEWTLVSAANRVMANSARTPGGSPSRAMKPDGIEVGIGSIIGCGSLDGPAHENLRAQLLGVAHLEKEKVPVGHAEETFDNNVAPLFDVAVLLCIAGNTITMAIESFHGNAVPILPGFLSADNCCDAECIVRDEDRCPRSLLRISNEMSKFLNAAEVTFSVIFSVELVIKIVAHEGFLSHFLENFPLNMFDFFVVIASDAVLIASLFVKTNVSIAVLRLMRIIRAFRLVSGFPRLRMLFSKAYSAFVSILYVLFVLIFWHVIGALLAMQLFSCHARNAQNCALINDECPAGCSDFVGNPPLCVFDESQIYENCPWDENVNFNTFLNGIIVLVYVTTGEAWSDIMGRGMRSYASVWPGMVFFIVFHVIGFYMLYNLFIGVIVQEFELTDEQKEDMQLGFFRVKILKELKRMRLKRRHYRDRDEIALGGEQTNNSSNVLCGQKDLTIAEEEDEDSGLGFFLEDPNDQIQFTHESPIFFGILMPPTPNAQFPDEPKNCRAYVRDFLRNVWFDRLILFSICLSAASLAMESPIKEYNSLDPGDYSLHFRVLNFELHYEVAGSIPLRNFCSSFSPSLFTFRL